MNSDHAHIIEMASYVDFLLAFDYYLTWAYDLDIPIGLEDFDLPTIEYRDLTGREIRQARRDCKLELHAIVSSMGPWQIGVRAPSWLWRRMAERLEELTTIDPASFNPLEFDPSSPGMRYASDRMILKEVFCGSIDAEVGELGTRWDPFAVGVQAWNQRADRWLESLIAQAFHINKREVEIDRAARSEIAVSGTEVSQEEAGSGGTVSDLPPA